MPSSTTQSKSAPRLATSARSREAGVSLQPSGDVGSSQAININQGQATINNQTVEVGAVVKVNPGAQYSYGFDNGGDDIAFKIGEDTYVATGRGFEGIEVGNQVNFAGKTGRVTTFNNERNTQKEAVTAARSVPGTPVSILGGIFGGLGLGCLLSTVNPFLGLVGGLASAVGLGLGINKLIGMAGGAIWKPEPINADSFKVYGSEV